MLTRQDYIKWILHMRKTDEDYARSALKWYAELLPEWELMAGVREALQHEDRRGVVRQGGQCLQDPAGG